MDRSVSFSIKNPFDVPHVMLEKGRALAVSVFGDSLLRGVMLDEKANAYRIHRGRFEKDAERFHLQLQNYSRFGFTVQNGEALIREKVTPEDHPALVFLEYGGNDCNFRWDEVAGAPDRAHDPIVPAEEFIRTYASVIDYVKSCGASPVVILPTPIDAERFLNWICRKGLDREAILRWLGSVDTIYRWQEYYTGLCEKLAAEKGCPVLDLRTPFLMRHDFHELIGGDGMHPTEKGHLLIDETFAEFWEKMEKDSV